MANTSFLLDLLVVLNSNDCVVEGRPGSQMSRITKRGQGTPIVQIQGKRVLKSR